MTATLSEQLFLSRAELVALALVVVAWLALLAWLVLRARPPKKLRRGVLHPPLASVMRTGRRCPACLRPWDD